MNPKLLTHPNIPKPLHGINPRTIMGKERWDVLRQEVYASTNYHCAACGVHKSKAFYHKWLEAHEDYDIDYVRGIVTINKIVPLCHACHNFIHSGRLYMLFKSGEYSKKKCQHILQRGFTILAEHNLVGFIGTYYIYGKVFDIDEDEIFARVLNYDFPSAFSLAEWSDWRLVYEGKEYKPKFKNYDEWFDFYNK